MNLKELSDHLGLSQATVSRALNGYREIRAETRARVVEAAEKYGYRPNSHARNLATGRARTLAMVFTLGGGLPLDPHFLEFLVGVSEWASRHDLSINLSTPEVAREEATYRHIMRTGLADGFIVNGPRIDDPRPGWLKSLRAPYVVHGSTEPAAPDSCVDIDNEGAFARATAHLLDLGHRRIALLNGPAHFTFAAHRELGFRRACAARGVAVDPSLLFATEMTEEQGFLLGRRALSASPRPTAFLCASLILALGLLRALADLGLSTPRDVSVIAHDDVFPFVNPASLRPALTTTRSPIREHGRHVAELLNRKIEAATPFEAHETIAVDLVLRESTGPAPGGV